MRVTMEGLCIRIYISTMTKLGSWKSLSRGAHWWTIYQLSALTILATSYHQMLYGHVVSLPLCLIAILTRSVDINPNLTSIQGFHTGQSLL